MRKKLIEITYELIRISYDVLEHLIHCIQVSYSIVFAIILLQEPKRLHVALSPKRRLFHLLHPVAEKSRRAYPALPGRADVGSIPANSDALNVPSFCRWRLEMKLSHLFFSGIYYCDYCDYARLLVCAFFYRSYNTYHFIWNELLRLFFSKPIMCILRISLLLFELFYCVTMTTIIFFQSYYTHLFSTIYIHYDNSGDKHNSYNRHNNIKFIYTPPHKGRREPLILSLANRFGPDPPFRVVTDYKANVKLCILLPSCSSRCPDSK